VFSFLLPLLEVGVLLSESIQAFFPLGSLGTPSFKLRGDHVLTVVGPFPKLVQKIGTTEAVEYMSPWFV